MANADIVITGGLVVDGTGAPGRVADVAIRGDRIVAIGPGLTGDRVLDATGAVVAPGFIDIHTHYDAQVFWDPALTPSCFHGVTTVVAGNCGFSIAPVRPDHHELVSRTLENVEDMDFDALMQGVPWDFETFAEYLHAVAEVRPALNFTAFVGHSAVRMAVMGDDAYDRHASPDEVEAMRDVIREAVLAGAAGFATSFVGVHLGADGKPVPSRVGTVAEFEALCAVLAELDKGVIEVSGTPYESQGIYDFQRRNGRPLTTPVLATAVVAKQIDRHRRQVARGTGVWPQVTPRELVLGITAAQPYLLNAIEAMGAIANTTGAERIAHYADPEFRNRLHEGQAAASIRFDWSRIRITESARSPELVGRPLSEVAAERDTRPLDVLLDAAIDDDLATAFQVVVANGDPDGVAALLAMDGVTLGLSDAGAHVGQLCDAPQATSLLADFVRDRPTLTVERAVRMLSGLQADLFGFRDRGYLREGAFADVTVFDLDRVAPGPIRRVVDLPGGASRLTADQPSGIVHVLVNGTPIVADDTPLLDELGEGPGTVFGPDDYRH